MVVVAVRDAQGEAGTGQDPGRGKRRKKINWAGKARISDLNLPPHCAPPGDDLSGRPLDRDEMAKTHSGHDASFGDLRAGAVVGGGGCAGRGVRRNACAMQLAARREKRVGDRHLVAVPPMRTTSFAAAHASRDRQSGAPDFVSRGLDSPRGPHAPRADSPTPCISRIIAKPTMRELCEGGTFSGFNISQRSDVRTRARTFEGAGGGRLSREWPMLAHLFVGRTWF
ncbi:hypothetical protein POSPLADRAFT_1048178 [Postia placenta MAD-698-R-SB12]|uniref:Uncharacterized protein n=1 Tax=Postia placenta MAD-698-R-SB12 TaxID=670580 RepID=A0A1X6MTU3_9APHY|nr:hypothetical protein POSPLADRAFT_1048178 [Postia placenta MAD-698-R-SB12]OSX59680.1 hypothetical protein POSPLADRAFT_1048178 [Postia placenta MAD-698-R-SB12]